MQNSNSRTTFLEYTTEIRLFHTAHTELHLQTSKKVHNEEILLRHQKVPPRLIMIIIQIITELFRFPQAEKINIPKGTDRM
jgi:hypothetical protein